MLTLSIVFPTRVPLRRVHPRHRTLNPLRAWGRPAQPPRLGSLTPGNKTGFVPLSNFMNVSHSPHSPQPASSSQTLVIHPASSCATRPSILGKSGWEHLHKTSLLSLTPDPPISGSLPQDAPTSVCPAVSFCGGIWLDWVTGGVEGWAELGEAPFSSEALTGEVRRSKG